MTELTLYEIESELEALVDSVETCPEELRGELEERIARYVTAEVDKIDRIGGVLSMLENLQVHARTEMARLRVREQSALKAAQRLEGYILRVLGDRNGKPLKGNTVTFSRRRTEVLIIDDAEAVPLKWKRTTVNVDIPRDPLKRAIAEGETIPGVHIEPREHLVRR